MYCIQFGFNQDSSFCGKNIYSFPIGVFVNTMQAYWISDQHKNQQTNIKTQTF